MNKPYKSLSFGVGEIPKGLQNDHTIKEGACAQLWVVAGELVFVDELGGRKNLRAGQSVSIASMAPHHLEDVSGASIRIDFYRVD